MAKNKGKIVETPSERIKNLLAKMTFRANYWGYLFSRIRRLQNNNLDAIMGVVPVRDGTIALHFHGDIVNNTSDKVLMKVLEHEGMHVLNMHIPRLFRILGDEFDKEARYVKSRIWNIAADCAINPLIKIHDTVKIDGKESMPCFPKLYGLKDYKTAEYYYFELLNQARENCKSRGGGRNLTEGDEPNSGKGDSNLDDHSQWKEGKDVVDIQAQARKMEQYTKDLIIDSLKNHQRKRGRLPGYIKRLIEEALEPPVIPYYQIIRKLVKGSRLSKFKRAHTKINRKRTYTFLLDDVMKISPFPGRTRDFSFNVGILIDTSGSMKPDDIKEALSGCKSIFDNDRHCRVTIIEVDTVIGKEYELKKVRDIDFEVTGGGGTELYPGVERFRELNPDIVLAFTDGYCEDMTTFPRKMFPKKLIWVITKDGSSERVDKTGYIVRL